MMRLINTEIQQIKIIIQASLKAKTKQKIYATIGALAIAYYFISVFLWHSHSNYIPYWDFANYSRSTSTMAQLITSDPNQSIVYLLKSISSRNYNFLPSLPLVPFALLFGDGRLIYLLSIVIVYLVPALLAFLWFQKQLFPYVSPWTTAFVFLLSPAIFTPIPLGYIDIGGLIIICFVLVKLLKQPVIHLRTTDFISLGILLALLCLFRRWYAIWVASLYVTICIKSLLEIFDGKNTHVRFSIFYKITGKILISTLVLIIILTSLALPIIRQYISKNYVSYFLSMDAPGAVFEIMTINYLGVFTTACIFAGCLVGIYYKRTRRAMGFLLILTLLSLLTFYKFQSLGRHHYYLLTPLLVSSQILLVHRMMHMFRNKALHMIVFALFITISFINFLSSYSPITNPVKFLFSRNLVYPIVRNDIAQLQKMLQTIKLHTSASSQILILSSSNILNSSIMQELCYVSIKDMPFCSKIMSRSYIDGREKPLNYANIDLVVVVKPIEYSRNPRYQTELTNLATQFLNSGDIGINYIRLKDTFLLDRNAKAYIFQKNTHETSTIF